MRRFGAGFTATRDVTPGGTTLISFFSELYQSSKNRGLHRMSPKRLRSRPQETIAHWMSAILFGTGIQRMRSVRRTRHDKVVEFSSRERDERPARPYPPITIRESSTF